MEIGGIKTMDMKNRNVKVSTMNLKIVVGW